MDQSQVPPIRPPDSRLIVCLGSMPRMLREILSRMLGVRPTLRVITGEVAEADPVALLRVYQPDALLLGRPDCDHIDLERLARASPATRIVQLSSDGWTAMVYEPNSLPATIERPSIEDLVAIVGAAGSGFEIR